MSMLGYLDLQKKPSMYLFRNQTNKTMQTQFERLTVTRARRWTMGNYKTFRQLAKKEEN